MISGNKIKKNIGTNIHINPYNDAQLNPNSYNLTLDNKLMIYKSPILDMKKNNEYDTIVIPETGYLLQPNILYLGSTKEYTKTYNFIPVIEGRSSVGRLGLFIHITAGFGDVGFEGYWTLELHCVQPIVIYPWMKICQISYHEIDGEYDPYNSDKYQKNSGVQSSQLYKEL